MKRVDERVRGMRDKMMKKIKIPLEDAVLIAKLMRECGADKEADRNNPNWRTDLTSMVGTKSRR